MPPPQKHAVSPEAKQIFLAVQNISTSTSTGIRWEEWFLTDFLFLVLENTSVPYLFETINKEIHINQSNNRYFQFTTGKRPKPKTEFSVGMAGASTN